MNTLEVVEALKDAWQVANAVAIAVLERARVNLVDDGFLPPPRTSPRVLVVALAKRDSARYESYANFTSSWFGTSTPNTDFGKAVAFAGVVEVAIT